ncbi:rhodanese-like domain-containing protein [Thiohalocapsa marina]|uniref:Rhodanese-like domain-containing protein n=1 Tax=Thiohalocapsa marina TaxID=424902 RepID=A0A5M8FMZ1_9GAMM|nr:rhodanese-like domain-containing protein [Thiohalocapsa marina]KAA6186258.1 rhodanese-like domain-containing protein [Thiohalocapsa marina]
MKLLRRSPFKILILIAFTLLASIGCANSAQDISAPEAFEKAKAGEVLLVDIRTPREWRQTGVATGARTIDMTSATFGQDLLAAMDGNKDAPIALICRTGNRTTHTQRALEKLGFTQVYNVKEGMAGSRAGPGWLRRGLPVEAWAAP